MVQKIGISLREHAWERIARAKPARISFSEWIETLAVKELDRREHETSYGPGRICTVIYAYSDEYAQLKLSSAS